MTPPLSRHTPHNSENYDSAYSLCMTAISKLSKLSSEYPSTKVIQIKIWCLYISLIAALLAENPPINTKKHEIKRLIERTPEKVCEEVYTTIVTKGYNNEDGEIPGEIILACMLLCLHQKSFKLARQIFEDWHDSLPELINNQLNHAAESAANYEKIVQLYLLNVLPNLKEWEKANSFLNKNTIIDKERKQNKKLRGIHNIPRQLINNRFFMSPTESRTSILDTFCVYLHQASSNISIPKIIPFFIFIILLTSGWNKNFKSSLRGFMINGFAKFWETIKAGTTLTNV
ncbi:1576_t:CDS:2 [Diversispora eburnea]|uniref:1576_t:CDS:1 n=1 Tax=Diversispora eburnea TaxID=1213867 RepID=A0A9N8UZW8_9GLOM|nr:1576_t:CDS:2 [Diversispora eburnea]